MTLVRVIAVVGSAHDSLAAKLGSGEAGRG